MTARKQAPNRGPEAPGSMGIAVIETLETRIDG